MTDMIRHLLKQPTYRKGSGSNPYRNIPLKRESREVPKPPLVEGVPAIPQPQERERHTT